MKRAFLFCLFLAGAFFLFFPPVSAAGSGSRTGKPKRPNILWIVTEDNSPFFGCYGDKNAVTPNLDRFASQGILYLNAFAKAPVCAPARSTIITGVYAPSMGTQHMRSRNRIPPFIRLFPRYLREAGYWCSNHSKTDYNLTPVDRKAWNEIRKGEYSHRRPGQPFFSVYNIATTHESSLHRGLDLSLAKENIPIPPYHPPTPVIRVVEDDRIVGQPSFFQLFQPAAYLPVHLRELVIILSPVATYDDIVRMEGGHTHLQRIVYELMRPTPNLTLVRLVIVEHSEERLTRPPILPVCTTRRFVPDLARLR